MIGADLFIALAGVGLAIIALKIEPPIWTVLAILFLRSAGAAFHTPAMSAVTPLIVPEDMLVKCAGYSSSIQSVSFLVSPAIAAVVYKSWSISAIVGLDVLGAIIAVLFVAFIAIPKPEKSELVGQESFFSDLKNGWMAIRDDKGLFQMLWIGTLYMLVFMPINALFPLMSMAISAERPRTPPSRRLRFPQVCSQAVSCSARGAASSGGFLRWGCRSFSWALGSRLPVCYPRGLCRLCRALRGNGLCRSVSRRANRDLSRAHRAGVPGPSVFSQHEHDVACNAGWANARGCVCRGDRRAQLVPHLWSAGDRHRAADAVYARHPLAGRQARAGDCRGSSFRVGGVRRDYAGVHETKIPGLSS